MKRLGAVLTLFVLGASASVVADPYHHRDRDDRYDRYDRHDRDDRVPRNEWTTLATHVRIDGHHAVRIDLNGARLRALEVQAMRGSAHVYSVGIIYSDRRQGAVTENRRLDARTAPNMRVDLGPEGMRGVEAVVVDAEGSVAFRVIGG